MSTMMQRITVVTLCLWSGIAAAAPCNPVKTSADLVAVVQQGCSPITFDASISGQTLTVKSQLSLAKDVLLDGGTQNVTIAADPTLGPPLFKIASSGAKIQNITITNPTKIAVYISGVLASGNTIINSKIVNSRYGIYVSDGAGNWFTKNFFSGISDDAIKLTGSGNAALTPPTLLSVQLKANETEWEIKGIGPKNGMTELYEADAPIQFPAQGKTFKVDAPIAADGTFSITLPYPATSVTIPYTMLVYDATYNTSPFMVKMTPEKDPGFYAVADLDGDKIFNSKDNCPVNDNAKQEDFDKDGVGDACDNCPSIFTEAKGQDDQDADKIGDACDDDIDGDTFKNFSDNCPVAANVDQSDVDSDGTGDVCDKQSSVDADNDGAPDVFDNCPTIKNPSQSDVDADNIGDACDEDADGDGVQNLKDNCQYASNSNQADTNKNGVGDVCETANGVVDSDGDGMPDAQDNCPAMKNVDQADADVDGSGDACDEDIDGDAVENWKDNCPLTANANQANVDTDALGDACEIAGDASGSQSAGAPATGSSGCSLSTGAAQMPLSSALTTSALAIAVLVLIRKSRKTLH